MPSGAVPPPPDTSKGALLGGGSTNVEEDAVTNMSGDAGRPEPVKAMTELVVDVLASITDEFWLYWWWLP